MVKVKICGIASLNDALWAVQAGADAVGFLVGQVHASTSTFVSADAAAGIIRQLPPFISSVLVTHFTWSVQIVSLAKRMNVTTVQLHGDTTPEGAAEARAALPHAKIYKVVHVQDESSIEYARRYDGVTHALVLDTAVKSTGQVGGTGKTHDWHLSARIAARVDIPVILAGGLNPENVAGAIRAVRPYAVDVNSGVSLPEGGKCAGRMDAFVRNAKFTRHDV